MILTGTAQARVHDSFCLVREWQLFWREVERAIPCYVPAAATHTHTHTHAALTQIHYTIYQAIPTPRRVPSGSEYPHYPVIIQSNPFLLLWYLMERREKIPVSDYLIDLVLVWYWWRQRYSSEERSGCSWNAVWCCWWSWWWYIQLVRRIMQGSDEDGKDISSVTRKL